MIISLSDYNQKQLKDIAQEREELIRDYEEKKAGEDSWQQNRGLCLSEERRINISYN